MLKIRKLGILKMALFSGLFSFFLGLISFLLVFLFGSLLIGFFMQVPSEVSLDFTSLLLLPFGYGIMGFIMGLIFTPIMNLVFRIIRGLDIVIEEPEEKPSVAQEIKP